MMPDGRSRSSIPSRSWTCTDPVNDGSGRELSWRRVKANAEGQVDQGAFCRQSDGKSGQGARISGRFARRSKSPALSVFDNAGTMIAIWLDVKARWVFFR